MESLKSLMRQGLVGAKHANRIHNLKTWAHGPRGTTAHASKMAEFNEKSKTDEHVPSRGAGHARKSHINTGDQDHGPRMSRGGAVNRGGQPTVKHIDREQKPKFPAGGKAKAGGAVGVRGGAMRPSGPMYGGPSGRP